MRLIVLIIFLFTSAANAHPTSFEGARGIMGFHTPENSHNQFNYSWRHWLATGAHHFTSKKNDFEASFLTTNFLLKRWNTKKLQSNFYLGLGPGLFKHNESDGEAALGLIQFDVEDRQYYFLVKHQHMLNKKKNLFQHTTVRAGLAPYIAPSEFLHSWFILEYSSRKLDQKKTEDLTPLLRLFYNNLLFEVGISFKGQTHFNYIIHF